MLLPQEALVATVTALPNYVWDSFRCEPRPDPVPDARDSSDVGGSRGALVAMVIAATGPTRPGRAASRVFATSAGHSARMRSSLTPLGPPVSRDRIITSFPKWYTPDACLQLKEHFHGQVSATCQRRNTGTVGLRLSKVVVVGDLYVGKTSLIHRFCKNVFDRDYKATIGVDFEIERFEIAGIPYSLQMSLPLACLALSDPIHQASRVASGKSLQTSEHLFSSGKWSPKWSLHAKAWWRPPSPRAFPRLDIPPPPHPSALTPLPLSLSLCLLPCQTPCLCLLVACWLQPLPSCFLQNSPEPLLQAHTFPPGPWTQLSISSGTWKLQQVCQCVTSPSRFSCVASSLS
ncbi:ras-related protein Rab-36 isoform X3 [Lutra lutra]|uniref:ras-related protein Rab-36 isoform X3 n=1 Tax=Lutra lutra TaxID=9657 RepID=UPI001FCFA9AB|nr:ras-related protein Rab-36 isoform X3 [Lutra lutra]